MILKQCYSSVYLHLDLAYAKTHIRNFEVQQNQKNISFYLQNITPNSQEDLLAVSYLKIASRTSALLLAAWILSPALQAQKHFQYASGVMYCFPFLQKNEF